MPDISLIACIVLARFGDRQGIITPLDQCHITVQGVRNVGLFHELYRYLSGQNSDLGNELYRYVSGAGAAHKLMCKFCAPAPMVRWLTSMGFDVPLSRCPGAIRWQDVRESSPYMVPTWRRAGNLRLTGYLQSHEYHHGKPQIAFNANTQDQCDKLTRAACPSGVDVSMHVRGGDMPARPRRDHYLPHIQGCVVVVSDEPKWVKANLPSSVHYISSSPAVDMCIAGSGAKQVLSGGTFDFFAAYFAKHKDVHMDRLGFRWDLQSVGDREADSYAPRSWMAGP